MILFDRMVKIEEIIMIFIEKVHLKIDEMKND